MALVECCLSNVTSDAREALHGSDHHVREAMCLDRCGDCFKRAFLIVDGEFETAETHRDLLDAPASRREESGI